MDLNRDTLLSLYKTMTTIRHFEERGIPETGQRQMSACLLYTSPSPRDRG